VQVHGRVVGAAAAGERTAVNLGGVEVADIARGETLASPGSLAVTRRADVDLEMLSGARPLRHGSRVRVHHGTAEILARVSLGGPELTEVPGGGRAPARLRFESRAALTRGDRVVLRAYSPPATIGAATVLDPAPLAPAIRTAQALARLQELRAPDAAQALLAIVGERGLRGLPAADAVSRGGLSPAAATDLVDRLVARGHLVRAGDRLVFPTSLDQAARHLLALVAEFHRQQPLSDGVPREEARARLFARVEPAVFEVVVTRLGQAGAIVDRERLALAAHRVALSGDDQRAMTAVEEAYRRAGIVPPDAAGLAAFTGLPATVVEKVTTLLLRARTLVKLDPLVLHRDALEQLKRDMAALKAAAGPGEVRIDVAQFKDRYGLSRKYAIPLLEYLDRERVTRRVGDARILL
jgi:selenocysteine-specific elongation factor